MCKDHLIDAVHVKSNNSNLVKLLRSVIPLDTHSKQEVIICNQNIFNKTLKHVGRNTSTVKKLWQ